MRETKRIGREAARSLLASQGVEFSERARNYELERELDRLPGALGRSRWIINEPCPFNGHFSRFGEHLSFEEQVAADRALLQRLRGRHA